MKTKILYLTFLLCCSPSIVLSQTGEKISSKAEMASTEAKIENPLIQNARENTLRESEKNNSVWPIKPVSLGTYSSGYILRNEYPWMKAYGIGLAIYPSGSASYRNNILTEMIPYQINIDKPGEFRGSDITTFWDPGISVFSPNKKFSVDLYKKSSTQIFLNGPGKATPFLLNLHF